MQISVLFFGPLSELCGCHRIQVTTGGTVHLLLEELELRFPALKGMPFKVSLNSELSTTDKELKQGDEVALLPPFAGG